MKTRAEIARYLSDRIDALQYGGYYVSAQPLMEAFEYLFGPYGGAEERHAIVARLEAEESAETVDSGREADPLG